MELYIWQVNFRGKLKDIIATSSHPRATGPITDSLHSAQAMKGNK